MPRGGKPPVSWDQAVEWERRNRQGETVPQIASKDDFDIRSVRKHINRVKEESETTEARTELYKEVLREHFQELTDVARQLDRAINDEADVTLIIAHPLAKALQEHLPKSQLWPALGEWKTTLNEELQGSANLRDAIKKAISEDVPLAAAFEGGRMDVEGVTNLMMSQVDNLDFDPAKVKSSPMESSAFQVKYDEYLLGVVRTNKLDDLIKVLGQFILVLQNLEEYRNLTQIRKTKLELKSSILDTLTGIIYKKLVPGRCRFCPF
ncbi:MAG: hypothetical protein AAC990_06150 [Dehalococcoides mccartyi]|uniref:hypothetical protein n=1 Tax=Dehalococcoides mccartyi TaxID=61435 RepID=UPI0030FAC614